MRHISLFAGIVGVFGLIACSSADEASSQNESDLVGPHHICEHAAPPMGCHYTHVGPGACDDRLECPTFEGSFSSQPVKLGTVSTTLLGASTNVSSLTKEMTDANDIQNDTFQAGSYASSPALLAAFKADKTMAYDIMFRLDGSAPGANSGFGWAAKYEAKYESLSCKSVPLSKAEATFSKFQGYQNHQGDDQIPAQKRALIKSDMKKLISTFVGEASSNAELFNCHWDNNDDSDADSLVLIDDRRVHVVMVFAGG